MEAQKNQKLRLNSLRYLALVVLGASSLLIWPGSASALTDEEIFREFRFNFLSPGARALGMGGAFVAIADDPTAAESNPAGLQFLSEPGFYVELRSIDEDTNTFRSNLGSLAVDPMTGARDLPFLGLTSVSSPDTATKINFLSYAWPMRLGGGANGRRLTLAGSRQVVLSQDSSLSSGGDTTQAEFSFDSFPNTVSGGMVQAYSIMTPITGSGETEIVYWNASAALEVHPDFSLGLTLSYATLDQQTDTLTRVEDPLGLFSDPGHPRLPSQPTTDLYRTTIEDSDSDIAYTFGIHWHPDSVFPGGGSPWRFGAVFHKGASFEVQESTFLNDVADRTFQNKIVVPDRFGIGVSYKTPGPWLFTAEIEQVEYSDMLSDFQSGVNYLTSGRVAGGAFGIDPAARVTFDVDDGTIFRAGTEYVHPLAAMSGRRLTYRVGFYRMPDDRIRMTQFNSDDADVNALYLNAFRGGEDVDHFTAGLGFRQGRYAVQIAGDTSDDGTRIAGSFVMSFRRK